MSRDESGANNAIVEPEFDDTPEPQKAIEVQTKGVAMIPNDTAGEWESIRQQAWLAFKSGLLPKAVNTPEKAAVIALKGRELGLPVMRSLSAIYVVDGKPCLSAELMLELIFNRVPGAEVNFITPPEQAHLGCLAEFIRPGLLPQRFGFTIEDAQRAGLTGKDNWRKYPADMCRARVISRGARAVFPDAIGGCRLVEEALPIADDNNPNRDRAKGFTERLTGVAALQPSGSAEALTSEDQSPPAPVTTQESGG